MRHPRGPVGDAPADRGRRGPAGRSTTPSLRTQTPSTLGPLQQWQRLAGNDATRILVSRQTVEDEPAGPGSGHDQGGASTGDLAALPGTAPATTAPTATERRLLRRGSRGPDVAELQVRLNGAGVAATPLEPDGIFGGLTLAAVQEYQRRNPPLVVDGLVGPQTWASLESGGGGGTEPPQIEPPRPTRSRGSARSRATAPPPRPSRRPGSTRSSCTAASPRPTERRCRPAR